MVRELEGEAVFRHERVERGQVYSSLPLPSLTSHDQRGGLRAVAEDERVAPQLQRVQFRQVYS